MKNILFLTILFLSLNLSAQTNWYVDYINGSNLNPGNSLADAVKTIDEIKASLLPSDTVFFIGEQHNPSFNPDFVYGGHLDRNNPHIWHSENTIRLSGIHGAENQFITFKAYDETTVFKGDGGNIIRVTNCSYLRFEGLEIYGNVENIPLDMAEGLQTDGLQFLYLDANTVDPQNPTLAEVLYRVDKGTTIEEIELSTYPLIGSIPRPSYTDTRGVYISNCNHIDFINNTVHHTCGTGVRFAGCSYVNIIGNDIHNCSRRSYSGTHALVVTKAEIGTIGAGDDPIYNIKIMGNKVRDNYNEIFSWTGTKTIITPRIDEGKGISLQRNNLTSWISSNKRILVANNLCYWNGFSGVHSNDGHHIDFFNNTCFMNSYTNTVSYSGQEQAGNNIGISCQEGNDIRIINNISYIDNDWNAFAISSGGTTNVVVENNMIFGTTGAPAQDADITSIEVNTTIANPLFTNSDAFDFTLQASSPAIGIANSTFAPETDYFENIRDQSPDLGAFEYLNTVQNIKIAATEIKLFPNPATNYFKVETKGDEIYRLEIFSLTGKLLIQEYRQMHINKINVNSLPRGVYIIKVHSKKGSITQKKIIKN